MGYEFEIHVWQEARPGGEYKYVLAWQGSDYEETMRKLKELKAQYPGNCVKLEWR